MLRANSPWTFDLSSATSCSTLLFSAVVASNFWKCKYIQKVLKIEKLSLKKFLFYEISDSPMISFQPSNICVPVQGLNLTGYVNIEIHRNGYLRAVSKINVCRGSQKDIFYSMPSLNKDHSSNHIESAIPTPNLLLHLFLEQPFHL